MLKGWKRQRPRHAAGVRSRGPRTQGRVEAGARWPWGCGSRSQSPRGWGLAGWPFLGSCQCS